MVRARESGIRRTAGGESRPIATDTQRRARLEQIHNDGWSASAPIPARRESLERDLLREAALRAIGRIRTAVLVVDCEERRIACFSTTEGATDSRFSKGRLATAIVNSTIGLLSSTGGTDPTPSAPLVVRDALILAVVPIAPKSESGTSRCVAVEVGDQTHTLRHNLSPREQEVARLLADGYSYLNIAVRSGVSINTIRTLTRRLYRKLGVFNRADLVRAVLEFAL